jgi:hypothetical protein
MRSFPRPPGRSLLGVACLELIGLPTRAGCDLSGVGSSPLSGRAEGARLVPEP